MRRRSTHTEYKESLYAKDLVEIMKAGTGPYTRKMLAEELSKKYPSKYWQELMYEVGAAIQMDKWAKANRFKVARQGWYDLGGR